MPDDEWIPTTQGTVTLQTAVHENGRLWFSWGWGGHWMEVTWPDAQGYPNFQADPEACKKMRRVSCLILPDEPWGCVEGFWQHGIVLWECKTENCEFGNWKPKDGTPVNGQYNSVCNLNTVYEWYSEGFDLCVKTACP
jgi:hypothetical protein